MPEVLLPVTVLKRGAEAQRGRASPYTPCPLMGSQLEATALPAWPARGGPGELCSPALPQPLPQPPPRLRWVPSGARGKEG